MSKKLNVFIDGSWLYKACLPEGVLASKTEKINKWFPLNFKKLNKALLRHIQSFDPVCNEIGDAFIATSIFEIPEDFDDWPNNYNDISDGDIERIKRNVNSRNYFATNAVDAGYSTKGIFRPRIKGYMVKKYKEGRYQEKQVDTTVVALLVKSAITKSEDYHALITGDSDMIPAITTAYPEYSKNVLVATTHPDELTAEHRQTSFSLSNFSFEVDTYYFQDHIKDIMHGNHVYECAHCRKVFARAQPIPSKDRPCCSNCNSQRK